MIRRNLLKATLLTTVIATLLVSTACGGKDQASTATEAQTTTVAFISSAGCSSGTVLLTSSTLSLFS